mmetsp:Transcript_10474/g.23134  ORF Transcript_10474/g.23134 Transcript_10474/m.23134 type:complete len:170 (-) Transcript_10474:353-862(-)
MDARVAFSSFLPSSTDPRNGQQGVIPSASNYLPDYAHRALLRKRSNALVCSENTVLSNNEEGETKQQRCVRPRYTVGTDIYSLSDNLALHPPVASSHMVVSQMTDNDALHSEELPFQSSGEDDSDGMEIEMNIESSEIPVANNSIYEHPNRTGVRAWESTRYHGLFEMG